MHEVNPKETSRAQAFELWMSSPQPMVTFVKTFNVSRLLKMSQRTGLKFSMIIGTSAIPHTELDCIINQYSGRYNNPFLAWGRYHKGWMKTTLPISFQFHHTQMDGAHAGKFFASLQEEINNIYR